MYLLLSNYGGLTLLLHISIVIILGGIYEVLKQIRNEQTSKRTKNNTD